MEYRNLTAIIIAIGLFVYPVASEAKKKSQRQEITEINIRQAEIQADGVEMRSKIEANTKTLDTVLKNQADIKEYLESISTGINELSGRVDEENHHAEELARNLKTLIDSDFLTRLNALDHHLSELRSSVTEASLDQDHKVMLLQEDLEATFITLFNQIDLLMKAVTSQKTAMKNDEPEKAEAPTANPVPADIQPEELYRSAYRNFLQADYKRSALEFSEYVRRYPTTDLTDNSQYWLGESLAKLDELEESVAAFKSVADNYPESTKAPSALWRASEILEKMGQSDEATKALEKIRDDYRASPQATLAMDKLNLQNN